MANAQQWLDENYPKSQRKQIINLDISNKELEGSLKLENFTKLCTFGCQENQLSELDINECTNLNALNCQKNKLTKLSISNCKEIRIILCQENYLIELDVINCFELINLNCSHNELKKLDLSNCANLKMLACFFNQLSELELDVCIELTNLYCSENYLTGLKLNSALEALYCANNKLTMLDINNCSQLSELNCLDNEVKSLNFLALNQQKLTYLSIANNNFSEQNISCFSNFVNLNTLLVGTSDKQKIRNNVYNRFYGSLSSLKNLTKLKGLHIDATNLEGNLNDLPQSLEKLDCKSQGTETRVKKIEEELAIYEGNFQKWKERKTFLATNNFLRNKQILLNTRQGTIQRLQSCCNELEVALHLGKYAKIAETSSAINNIGNAINTSTFGLVSLVGALGLAANDSAKRKFITEKINEYNNYLLTDEKKIEWFKERYNAKLDNNSEQSFNDKYNLFNIIDNVWKNKSYLSLEEMKEMIKSLSTNHKELEKELRKQEKELEQVYQAQIEQP